MDGPAMTRLSDASMTDLLEHSIAANDPMAPATAVEVSTRLCALQPSRRCADARRFTRRMERSFIIADGSCVHVRGRRASPAASLRADKTVCAARHPAIISRSGHARLGRCSSCASVPMTHRFAPEAKPHRGFPADHIGGGLAPAVCETVGTRELRVHAAQELGMVVPVVWRRPENHECNRCRESAAIPAIVGPRANVIPHSHLFS